MIYSNGNKLINDLSTGQTLSGLDLGDKTIGVAISDKDLIIGSPIKTIQRKGTNKDIKLLKEIFIEFNVGGIILGFPLSLNGKENARTKKTREFANILSSNLLINIFFQDERYSTDIVYREMKIGSLSNKKIKKYIDKAAAAYILQGFLNKYNKK